MTLGAFILGFSSIFTGINFIVTIHKMRAPGMTWFNMPLFVWGMYATSLIQVMATPVLGITLLLLIFERAFGIGVFDPALGGDPVLYQHFLLVLLASSSLCDDFASDGNHFRTDCNLFA